ncbi:MAG: electron transfer flavoprotein subunit alpha/FixB family protein [Hespellia sp.]|nr:electron transfer flavoprotein subunit alpha/FixB family protein [Hespellia sp.]
MNKVILVYLQLNDGIINPVGFELIGKAYELSRVKGHRICAVLIGNKNDTVKDQLKGQPVHQLFYIETKLLYNVKEYAGYLGEVCRELEPDIFLLGATKEGRSLAPYVAAQLSTGLTADCTELKLDEDGKLRQIRPAFGESVLADIKTRTLPQMATVRPGMMERFAEGPAIPTEICYIDKTGSEKETMVKVVSVSRIEKVKDVDITKQDVLVILGAGISSREDASVLERWAQSLSGTFACSRKLVERGWYGISRQVGLSGNAVNAKLIITIGVSGSVQFQAGIKKVKNIIAINHDEAAPIMQIAKIPIVQDLNTVIEKIKEWEDERDDGMVRG